MEEEYRSFTFKFGVLMLRTKKGLSLLDKLGNFRVTKPLAWIMLYIMPVAAAAALLLLVRVLAVFFSPQGTKVIQYIRTIGPLANLVLPGINPYIPIIYGWLALVVAVFVHEASHGIVARSLGFPVKSAGLLFFLIIPVGAFVEVDDKQLRIARARDSGRVLAAGSGINFIIAIVCLALLLFGVVPAMRPSVNGVAVVGVYGNTAASKAGIMAGDYITAINGIPINDSLTPQNSSWYQPGHTINVTIVRDGKTINLDKLTLGSIELNDTRTGEITQRAFLGVSDIGYQGLQGLVSTYKASFFTNPNIYLCIPTLPLCQGQVPFSDSLVGFYSSSLGPALYPLANLLYWLFFININLSIFNSLPIYPMDGGQAFEAAVKSLGNGKITEDFARRITSWVTFVIVAMILVVVVGPYLSQLFF